jgi:hypothetical protein
MKEEIYNEQELQKLEEEIRAMGIPYSQDEPDDRYFANFRVRLMDHIDAKEEKSIAAKVWSWLSSSPLRSLSLSAGLAGVVIAALLIQPTPEVQIAKVEQAPKTMENPAVTPSKEALPFAEAFKEKNKINKSHRTYKTNQTTSKPDRVTETANTAGNFAAMDSRLSGDADDPVNLESLSVQELESVLAAVKSMK